MALCGEFALEGAVDP